MSKLHDVAERLLNVMRERNGWPPTTLDSMQADHRAEWLADARAAVEALRVPGDMAIDQGARCCNEEDDTGAALAVWTTMIDAILAEDANGHR